MGLETAGIVQLGLGAVQAFSQIGAGKQQAKAISQAGEYNAQVYEQQAGMIQNQKTLLDYQHRRAIAKLRGSTISHTAGAGLDFSGSPVAIAIDNESNLLLDQSVENYNLDVQRQKALSAAAYSRESASSQSSIAKSTGYGNAFTSILNTATSVFAKKA